MPREKRYESRAAQQAAYRERLRAQESGRPPWEKPEAGKPRKVESLEERREAVKELVIETALSETREQEIRDRYGYSPSERRSKAERDEVARRILAKQGLEQKPPLTEEEYVAEQLALTRAYIKHHLRPLVRARQDPPDVVDKTSPQAVAERLERAEAYARWRYRGFLNGEIGSL
jgi:hypothetical protein